MVFEFTGVSLIAARAVNVGFSAATAALLYLLIRRYGGTQTTAAVAAVLLAASPFAFAFSRVATLDTMVVFEWVLMVWAASYADREHSWPLPLLGLLMGAMVLTKTTSLALLPSIFWLLWKRNLRALLTVTTLAGAVLGLYLLLVLRSRYAGDYHYFFNINALAGVELGRTGSLLQQLFHNGLWIDRILYPASLAILTLSLIWLRRLWRNPLFAASWIAFAGNALYILRRQDDYAPRYFLVMLVPLILVLVLTLQELEIRHRGLAMLLAATLTVAVFLDTGQIFKFLAHRQYQFYGAAKSIQATVNADPAAKRLLLGTSADQLSLMIGIPAINDGYSSEDLTEKVSRYQPGWYVGWNDLDQDILESLTDYHLDQVASYPVFDHEDRNQLKLYRMVPLKDERK
jgi:4-amino-4-deoxy-L-arabinose transferase-like glycosyltransferase